MRLLPYDLAQSINALHDAERDLLRALVGALTTEINTDYCGYCRYCAEGVDTPELHYRAGSFDSIPLHAPDCPWRLAAEYIARLEEKDATHTR